MNDIKTLAKKQKGENDGGIKLNKIPVGIYLLMAVVIIGASLMGSLPGNMVGALGFSLVLGIGLGYVGDRIPIWNEYIGGGAILTFIVSAYLVYSNRIPQNTIDTITYFVKDTDFLDLFIAVLITGSMLAVSRKVLLKAIVGYIPIIIAGIAGAMLFGIVSGFLVGIPASKIITMYVLPIMGGGSGAGALPMSEIYSNITGNDAKEFLSFAYPILTIANIMAIFIGSMLNKIGDKYPKLTGNGELIKNGGSQVDEKPRRLKLTIKEIGAGLVVSTFFYITAYLLSKKLLPSIGGVQIHTFAYMVLIVALFNALNLIPEDLKQGAKKLQSFFSGQFLCVIMVCVGIVYTDLGEIIQALTIRNMIVAAFIVIGAVLATGICGFFLGFYPVEASITAGLCMANRGGSGDLEVLGASKRMNLISFAQISSRLGGGIMLVVASIVFGLLL